MIRQLVFSYVILVAVALAAFTVPVAFTLTDQLRGDTEASALREAAAMARLLANENGPSRQALDAMAEAYQEETSGTVEVLSADQAGDGTTVSWGSESLVVTVPARARGDGAADGRVIGAVRIDYPTDEIIDRLWSIWGFRALLAVGVLAAAALLGVLVARRLTRPLRQLNDMARLFSNGDLTARAPVTGPEETQTLARALNSGSERLDTLVTAQRIFVADASHQLRTPLTALRLSLDNIADSIPDTVDDDFVRDDVEQATAEVVRMSRLVSGLLVLARAEAEVAAVEPLPLHEMVAERLSVWRIAGEDRGVRFRTETFVDGPRRVLASPGHLEQVLDNVLSNALEVSPDGGTVTVRTVSAADEVVLEVLDEGPGMSDAEKSRAFDRFWRGQGLTGRTGSGLGLAVVKQLLSDDGGKVVLDDSPTGGLCVRISLRPEATRSGG